MDENKRKPQIRFRGFTGEWEERKLGDITEIATGKLDANAMKADGYYDFYTSGIKKYKIDISAFKGPAITIAGNGATVGYMHYADGEFNAYQRTYVLSLFKVNREFLFSEIRNKLPKKIRQEARTGNIPYIVLDMLTDLKIDVPTYDEQTKIGIFFKQLDNFITLQQRKCDQLKNVKKSMLEKMFPKNGADVPEIRFAGFREPWEKRKYSYVFTNISNNTLARVNLNYNTGTARNVHYGDVLIKFGELLDIEKDEIPYITDDVLTSKIISSRLQKGDVIIADAAEDETVGKCTELVNIGEEILVSGLHTIPCRPTFFFASGYLGYFMNSSTYHNQLLRLMQGTKVSSISKAALQDTNIFHPNDIDEQKQIGTFFKNLDNLITLNQNKLEKLKNIKKSCLEKMFV